MRPSRPDWRGCGDRGPTDGIRALDDLGKGRGMGRLLRRIRCLFVGHTWAEAVWKERVPRFYAGTSIDAFWFDMRGLACRRCGAKKLAHPQKVEVGS